MAQTPADTTTSTTTATAWRALTSTVHGDAEVAAVLAQACRLVSVDPLPDAPAAAALSAKQREALKQTVPATDASPQQRGAWLGSLYYALLRDRDTGNREFRTRAAGEHYTPLPVAHELAEACLSPLLNAVRTRDELLALRILEPAAGAGAFLCAAVALCAQRLVTLAATSHATHAAKPTLEAAAQMVLRAGVVRGLDRDPFAVALAQRVLALTFGFAEAAPHEFDALTAQHVQVADALCPTGATPLHYDAVLTNPPFVFARALPEETRRAYKDDYSLARLGQWDLYWLFAEAALTRWLRRDGRARLGLLLPEAVLARDESARLRRFLVERVAELEVRSLGRRFARAQTGIVALTATTRADDDKGNNTAADDDGVCTVIDGTATTRKHSLAALRRMSNPRFVVAAQPLDTVAVAATDKPRVLGDVVRIRRGDEVGKRSLIPIVAAADEPCPAGHVPVLTGASLAVPLAQPQPTHWMPRDLAKKPAAQFQPPTVVLAKTGREVHASVEQVGHRCLQSVYTLRLTEAAPRWLTVDLLCALLVAEPTQARWIRPVTTSKHVFPQITQSLLKQIALPPAPPAPLATALKQALANAATAPAAAKQTVDKLVAEWLAQSNTG